jgi:hypothetical protein
VREVRARAAELGAVEALSKPFDLNQVVAAVGRWIRVGPPVPSSASLYRPPASIYMIVAFADDDPN